MRAGEGWRAKAWGVLLVNLATLGWGTNAVLGRYLRDDIGPLTLSALRFSCAAIFFMVLLSRHAPEERRPGADRWWLLAMGFCGMLIFSPLLYLGLHHSTAVNSSLIQGFSPLITAMLAGWLIAEPAGARQKAGALLGLLGVVGLISGGSLSFLLGFHFNQGDLLLLAAAMAWSLYSVLGRRVMRRRSAVSATGLSTLMLLPLLLAAALLELPHVPFNPKPETLAAVLHICLVPTIVSYWCWNRAVQILGAGGAMAFYNTLPLYGVVMGALWLDEPLTAIHWVFGGLILAGGLWGTLSREPRLPKRAG
ncbi:MAG: DMT family transporter [Desulfarculus sp.]|nr:DMT family transporter [Desulfarculus sp.]